MQYRISFAQNVEATCSQNKVISFASVTSRQHFITVDESTISAYTKVQFPLCICEFGRPVNCLLLPNLTVNDLEIVANVNREH